MRTCLGGHLGLRIGLLGLGWVRVRVKHRVKTSLSFQLHGLLYLAPQFHMLFYFPGQKLVCLV